MTTPVRKSLTRHKYKLTCRTLRFGLADGAVAAGTTDGAIGAAQCKDILDRAVGGNELQQFSRQPGHIHIDFDGEFVEAACGGLDERYCM
jgi:hypothetical protein